MTFCLNETQLLILENLAVYKFLTVSQIVRLGVKSDRRNLSKPLRLLLSGRRTLIQRIDFGVLPTIGRLEHVYFLTKYGANYLIENLGYELENIKIPKGETLFARDYFHRKNNVTFEILFRQFVVKSGFEVLFFDTYYDMTGANNSRQTKRLTAKTKIEFGDDYLIADGIGLFQDSQEKHLLAMEICNGKDSKRIANQLRKHLLALSAGSLSLQHGLNKNSKVVCVFEFESCLEAVIRRLRELKEFSSFEKYLLFNTLEKIEIEFFSGWQLFSGQNVNFI